MQSTTFELHRPDGAALHVYRFQEPGQAAKAAVQIAHGMQEHAQRYAGLAEALTAAGYVVYANDHRGHGRTARPGDVPGDLGRGGWRGLVADLAALALHIQAEQEGLPLFMLGHSFGSFLVQAYIQKSGHRLSGAVLSGTNGRSPLARIGLPIARMVVKLRGDRSRARLLRKLSVGHFNKAFEPGETGWEWLSSDPATPKAYAADPMCGARFPNGFYLELADLLVEIWKPYNEIGIPRDLPVYIYGGSEDPVGDRGRGPAALAERYKAQGMKDVALRIYSGGRHEMHNETNREQVLAELVRWLNEKVKIQQAQSKS